MRSGHVAGRVADIATPLPFTLETNPQQTEFFVRLVGTSNPAVMTDQGRVRVVNQVAGTRGFVTDRGTADRAGVARQLSDDDTVLLNLAATGSLVPFNDRVVQIGAPLRVNLSE